MWVAIMGRWRYLFLHEYLTNSPLNSVRPGIALWQTMENMKWRCPNTLFLCKFVHICSWQLNVREKWSLILVSFGCLGLLLKPTTMAHFWLLPEAIFPTIKALWAWQFISWWNSYVLLPLIFAFSCKSV